MQINGATFITSAAHASQFITPTKPMIAICGKSNSGKSTLINLLANQKRLAKTSSAPGRTRLVNYFDFGAFVLADLPGYGYAAVSKEEKEKWGRTLDAFFARKEDLAHVFLLTDIRRDPSQDDLQMVAFLNYHIIPFTVIATKSDKLSRMKQKERLRAVANAYGLGMGNVLSASGLTGDGKSELIKKISEILDAQDSE
ncbi:MAG: YihA family ribosome biogenesis GTP-binding protein [Clostridia bacterium]|nr:YihA family ribosome biogenesis GTP-binding protein [Clostridia bacterium]